jgi:hypothetical protein
LKVSKWFETSEIQMYNVPQEEGNHRWHYICERNSEIKVLKAEREGTILPSKEQQNNDNWMS